MNDVEIRQRIKELNLQQEKAFTETENYDEFMRKSEQITKEFRLIRSKCIHKIDFDNRKTGDLASCNVCDEFFWVCLQSPTYTCQYDIKTDPHRDECIYCHQPLERK
ncbi:hypothetical protein ABGV42_00535 [Paenibacillus pabuli]|uniref:hypothetical protein n=1 Tax=Paenibacillus pabuli TaxID=1472 RepID=UPI0032427CDC